MNKSLTLILSALLTLSLAACGGTLEAPAMDLPPAGPTEAAANFPLVTLCHPGHNKCAR